MELLLRGFFFALGTTFPPFSTFRSEGYADSGGLASERAARGLESWSGPFHYSRWLVYITPSRLDDEILPARIPQPVSNA